MRRYIFLVLVMQVLFFTATAWPAPFTDNGNGTVTDARTGLVWQQGEPGNKTWGSALSYCEGLNLGNKTDWRLPNIKELESLTDDARDYPAIDTNYFPNAYASYYWSSTTYAYYPDVAWYVYFGSGGVSHSYKYGYMYVRCVRGGQFGSFGVLDHFDFSYISSPQSVGGSFSVTITAKDVNGYVVGDFIKRVTLSDSTKTVSPIYVDLVNGVGSTSIKIKQSMINNKLTAGYWGALGTSDEFQVGGDCSINIEGVVVDKDGAALDNATVHLTLEGSGEIIADDITGSDGSFKFDPQPCGSYELIAIWNGHHSDSRIINASSGVCPILEVDYPNVAIGKTPVVLVPGFLGSTLKSKSQKGKWDAWLPSQIGDTRAKLVFNDPFPFSIKRVGWEDIQDALKLYGHKVTRAPFDWRMSINTENTENAVDKYLIPAIDKAKHEAGDVNKVNIVAHSLGGLLVRSYIQSNRYRNDIDKFVMIGTPQRGGSLMYYLWEGGDVYDTVPYIREGSIENLKKQKGGKKWRKMTSKEKVEFIHDELLSGLETMPTPDEIYLKDYMSGDNKRATTVWKNTFLENLNNNRSIVPQKVDMHICYGKNNETMDWINTQGFNQSSDVYPDGFAIEFYEDTVKQGLLEQTCGFADGDGTVKVDSALPSHWGWEDQSTSVEGSHAFLPAKCKSDVVSFIDGSSSMASTSRQGLTTSAAATSIDDVLSIDISSGVEPLITNPSGQKYGMDTITGNVVREIANTTFELDQYGGGFSIISPQSGGYIVSLRGRVERDFTIKINYLDINGNEITKEVHGYSHNDVFSFTFSFDSTSPNPLTVNSPVPTPTGLSLQFTQDNNVSLSWMPVIDAGVSGYNIYRQAEDQPFPDFIGTSTTPSYTDLTSVTGKSYLYAVSAVNTDGARSFLSDYVRSDDRDDDKLTDAQEATLGSNPAIADTDGDGLDDGREYLYGTNPLLTDTDGDGYSDFQEILDGSDPLDENSFLCTDNDGDGYGNPGSTMCLNGGATDCNDNDPLINPSTLWYPDSDSDGYGNPSIAYQQCTPPSAPPNYVLNNGDYNDNDSNIYPGGPTVRVAGTSPSYYSTLQAAYNAASDGATIQVQVTTFNESLSINLNKTVTISGGYNGAYTTQVGKTTIQGNTSVTNGKIIVENLILQ